MLAAGGECENGQSPNYCAGCIQLDAHRPPGTFHLGKATTTSQLDGMNGEVEVVDMVLEATGPSNVSNRGSCEHESTQGGQAKATSKIGNTEGQVVVVDFGSGATGPLSKINRGACENELPRSSRSEEKGENVKIKSRETDVRTYLYATFLIHLVILFTLVTYEGVYLFLVGRVRKTSPYHDVKVAADSLQEAITARDSAKLRVPANTTLLSYLSVKAQNECAEFNNILAQAKADGWKILCYDITFTSIIVVITCLVMHIVYQNRNHPTVRSRGGVYLVGMFGTGLLAEVSAVLLTLCCMLQLRAFPMGADYLQLEVITANKSLLADETLYVFLFAVLVFCFFLALMVGRQRLIAYVFTTMMFEPKDPTAEQLRFAAVATLCGFALSAPFFFIWWARDGFSLSGAWYGLLGTVPMGVFYSVFTVYYSYTARKSTLRFNDFFCSIRCVAAENVLFFGVIVFCELNPHHVLVTSATYCAMIRAIVLTHLLDQFSTQVVQAYMELPDVRADLGRLTITTALRVVCMNTPSHIAQRENVLVRQTVSPIAEEPLELENRMPQASRTTTAGSGQADVAQIST